MELTHVKHIHSRSNYPTVRNSSLALPKTCFIRLKKEIEDRRARLCAAKDDGAHRDAEADDRVERASGNIPDRIRASHDHETYGESKVVVALLRRRRVSRGVQHGEDQLHISVISAATPAVTILLALGRPNME